MFLTNQNVNRIGFYDWKNSRNIFNYDQDNNTVLFGSNNLVVNSINSYGPMKIDGSINRSNSTGELNIFAGNNWEDSAYLHLKGKNINNDSPGRFILHAMNDTNHKYLEGRGDGTLLWDNKSLSDAAISTKNIVENNGFIVFNCGLILQWICLTEGISELYNSDMILYKIPMNIQPIHTWILGPVLYTWKSWDLQPVLNFDFYKGIPCICFFNNTGTRIQFPSTATLKCFYFNK